MSLQDSVSSAQQTVLEGKQREEEKVRTRLAALSDRLQKLNKEAVALVCLALGLPPAHVCE